MIRRLLACSSLLALSLVASAQSHPQIKVRLKAGHGTLERAALLAQGIGRVRLRTAPDTFLIDVTSSLPPTTLLERVRRRQAVASVESVQPELDAALVLSPRYDQVKRAVDTYEEAWKWHATAIGLEDEAEGKGDKESNGLDFLRSYLERLAYRSYPTGRVDHSGMQRLVQERIDRLNLPAAGPNWEYIGPRNLDIPYRTYYGLRPIIGRVGALAYHPTVSGTYYMGAAKGGVWKTVDAGVNWTPLGDRWPLLGVSSLAVSPTNGDLVLAGTGDHAGGNAIGFGVMRSTDGGQTWTATGGSVMGGACVSDIAFNPDNPSVVIATTGRGSGTGRIYRSLDGGQTWAVSLSTSADWQGLDVSVANAGVRTFWAVGDPGTDVVYKSSDNGATWTQVTVTGIGNSTIDVACSKVDPNTVYLLDSSAQRIRKTVNAGSSWTDTTTNFSNQWGQSWYDWHIHASRLNSADAIYVGLIDIAVSFNGGTSWRNMGGANWTATYTGSAITHNDQHSFAVNPNNPNEVLVGNDGGVYRSVYNPANDTITWSNLNRLLGITQFYTLAMHPTNALYSMGGTQDNATPNSFGDQNNWGNPGAGDGAGCLINPTNPANQYHSWYNQNIEKTENSFGTVQNITPSWSGHSTPFIGKLWFDPNNANLVYANTNYLNRYNRSTNSWSLQLGGQNFGGVIQSFAAAPSDSNRLYVGRSGQVWMSTAGGTGWVRIDRQGQSNGLPNRAITDISVLPTNANDLVVVVGSTGTAKVYRCTNPTDATPVWTPLTSGLPDVHHLCLARDPQLPATHWYVGNDAGVWRTTNGGATWTDYTSQNALPNVEVDALVAVSGTGYLNAGTYGRGIWRIPLRTTETVVPTTLTLGLGRITGGDVTSLAADDGNALTACKFIVPNLTSPIVTFEVTGTTTNTAPLGFSLSVRSRAQNSGQFTQNLALYDYANAAFTTERTDSMATGYATVTLAGTGTLSNYVNQGNGQVRARVQVRQTGPSSTVTPCFDWELANWQIQG